MKKKFRVVAGRKFYCDEKGILTKDAEGNFEEVADTDTTAEEVASADEATAEVEKMLSAAAAQARKAAQTDMVGAEVRATDAVTKLFEAIATGAEKHTKVGEGEAKSALDLDEIKKGFADLGANKRNVFSFTISSKADLDYLAKATSESGSLEGDVIEPARQPEISRDPVRQPFIESIADVVTGVQSDSLSYVEVVNESGAPAVTAELADIDEKDFEFQEFKAPFKKIAVINKHSVELLQDAPQLVAAIKRWLAEDVNIEVDNQLLNGSGVGDQLSGVMTLASELDDTEVGDKRVAFANLADVIRVAITKVAVAGKGKFTATYAILNPEDADALDLTKDESGQYVLPPFRSADGTKIKGARVIENVGIPAGKFLVGDFSKLHVGSKGGVEIEMTNADGTDFKKDILTVKLRRRIAAYVRQNDNGAFWQGDIADVIEALTQS